jgi:hypothetical protein
LSPNECESVFKLATWDGIDTQVSFQPLYWFFLDDCGRLPAIIIADYDAQSAVERELVLRLASLLWRLRRATIMETGLFEIQADHPSEFRQARQQALPTSQEVFHAMFGRADSISYDRYSASHSITNATEAVLSAEPNPVAAVDRPVKLTRCFLRLANLPNFALDRLSRYEATLWRQAGQILFALDALDRRKPQERKRRFNFCSLMR